MKGVANNYAGSEMKTASLLVVLAITLAVLGTGFSCSDYVVSSQTVTLTTVRSYVTTESSVTRTSTTVWLVKGEVIEIDAVGQAYCTRHRSFSLDLAAGQLHVSYSTNGSAVTFWMLTERDYQRLMGAQYCEDVWEFQAVDFSASKSGPADFTVQVPSSGTYHLVFENADKNNAARITLNIDRGIQETQFTMTSVRTVVSTQLTTLTTESTQETTKTSASTASAPTTTRTTSSDSEDLQSWMDYRLLLGLGAIIVAAVVAVLLLIRRRKVTLPAPTGMATQPAIKAASSAPAPAMSTKFCKHCGAKIPRDSDFCEECGARL